VSEVAARMVDSSPLTAFGWGEPFAGAFHGHASLGRVPARVVAEDRERYVVAGEHGETTAVVSGRFRFDAAGDERAFPAVGDWVAIDPLDDVAIVQAVLPRRTAVVRLGAGRRATAQVVAANVDVAFVVMSLNRDFNLRRLERYLAVVWESGAQPVVLLSKADVADDVDGRRTATEAVAAGVPVIVVSAVDGRGLDDVRAWLAAGRTVAALGSSGVGKSTLMNVLAGTELHAVAEVRPDDDRGRHTTRRRHLVRLPDGALFLDTPGMREIGLFDGDGLASSFGDVEATAQGCRFTDCRHESEPGCAVRAAIADGELQPERLAAFRKLGREAAHAERRTDALARIDERRRWKSISKHVGRQMDQKYGREWR
jgi:ribosome biogenesis GTPase